MSDKNDMDWIFKPITDNSCYAGTIILSTALCFLYLILTL